MRGGGDIAYKRHIAKRARAALYVAFVVSFVVHIFGILSGSDWTRREPKPQPKKLSVKFIQRPPRLVKPLELMKRPRIVQRQLMRRVQVNQLRTPRSMRTAAAHGTTVLASLARPTEPIDRGFMPLNFDLGPEIMAGAVETSKEPSATRLTENLLSAQDLDTGRYRAYVVQDPSNKRKVSGFLHIDQVRYETNFAKDWDGNPGWNATPRALPNLAEMLERFTDIKVDVSRWIRLDSEELMQAPFVVLTGEATFEWTNSQAENLGRYLRRGGFIFADDSSIPMIGSPFDRAARGLLETALGQDAVFEKVPNDHWLYHCFFDFEGPPNGFDVRFGRDLHEPYPFVEAIYLEGRMAALISNKAYMQVWDHAYNGEPEHNLGDPTRKLQFGVNIIVFALTQPGGIVDRQQAYQ
jgi:hypothetical protein